MSKTNKIFLFVLLGIFAIFFNSCIFFGISRPQKLSSEKIEKKSQKYHLREFEHFYATEDGFLNYTKTLEDNNLDIKITHALVFKNNKLVLSKDSVCYANGCYLIERLIDSNSYNIIDSIRLESFINKQSIYDFDSMKFISIINDCDFFIVIYWASFAGILNRNGAESLSKCLKTEIENKSLNAKAIYVNLDMKEDWDKDRFYKAIGLKKQKK